MKPNKKYLVGTLVVLSYFILYLIFAIFVYFNTNSVVFGLMFPFDWIIFLALIIWAHSLKKDWDFFIKKYPDSIEVFDWTNENFRGETVLLAITAIEIIFYKPRIKKEETVSLSTVKILNVEDFGIIHGGNPGFKKLKLKTSAGEFVLSVHKNDINYIIDKVGDINV